MSGSVVEDSGSSPGSCSGDWSISEGADTRLICIPGARPLLQQKAWKLACPACSLAACWEHVWALSGRQGRAIVGCLPQIGLGRA